MTRHDFYRYTYCCIGLECWNVKLTFWLVQIRQARSVPRNLQSMQSQSCIFSDLVRRIIIGQSCWTCRIVPDKSGTAEIIKCVTFNELRFSMYQLQKTLCSIATIQSFTAGTFGTLRLHYQDGHESSRHSIWDWLSWIWLDRGRSLHCAWQAATASPYFPLSTLWLHKKVDRVLFMRQTGCCMHRIL